MAVRAVIDTNVWVSSLLNPHGYPAKLRKAFEEGLRESLAKKGLAGKKEDRIKEC